MPTFTARDGIIPGLFSVLRTLMPDEDSHNRHCEDGYYATEDDLVIRISGGGVTIDRLGCDVDGSRCWVGAQHLIDNWYEGPYFDMLPLPTVPLDRLLGLPSIQKRFAFQPEPEHALEEDSFCTCPLPGAFKEHVRACARAELARWQADVPGQYQNKTGTQVGELDAMRSVGNRVRTVGHAFGEQHKLWTVAEPQGIPATYCLMVALMDDLEMGWAPELFLVVDEASGVQQPAWDAPALRELLDLAARAYDRAIPPIRLFTRDGSGSGDHCSMRYFRDKETGKRWEWKTSWTIYYSDGMTVHRPEELG